jgi:hypothetical protein
MTVGRIPVIEGGIQPTIFDAKADLLTATANDTPARLAVGANETRLVADSAVSTGLKYVADTTNYAIAAKGDLLAGTAADTVAALTVGANNTVLTADSSTATGLKWATPASGGLTLLSTTSVGTGTSVSISSISQSYTNLYIVLEDVATTSGNTVLRMEANALGNAGFAGATIGNDQTTAVTSVNVSLPLVPLFQNNGGHTCIVNIYYYSSSTLMKPVNSLYAAVQTQYEGGGFLGAADFTTAISTLVFRLTAGNFSRGTIKIYGVTI